jgi:hypothetical protein
MGGIEVFTAGDPLFNGLGGSFRRMDGNGAVSRLGWRGRLFFGASR